tara:strand:+ start:3271 stop:3543 length:273 start_codon:yes stop_codon:yes gene_type:complete
MSENEKIFADGFSFKRRENAPDFVVGRLTLKIEDALPFIKERANNGWLNLNINIGRSGKPYVELDTWTPDSSKTSTSAPQEKKEEEPLPF